MKSGLSKTELPESFVSVDTDRPMHVLHLDVKAFKMQFVKGLYLDAQFSNTFNRLWVMHGNKRRTNTAVQNSSLFKWISERKGEVSNLLHDTLCALMEDKGMIDGHDAFVFAQVSDSSQYKQVLNTEVVVPNDQPIRGMKWYLVAVVEKT